MNLIAAYIDIILAIIGWVLLVRTRFWYWTIILIVSRLIYWVVSPMYAIKDAIDKLDKKPANVAGDVFVFWIIPIVLTAISYGLIAYDHYNPVSANRGRNRNRNVYTQQPTQFRQTR